jgi:cell division septum initiation protein DivIVA
MLATVEKEVEKLIEEVLRLERENDQLRLRIKELEAEVKVNNNE